MGITLGMIGLGFTGDLQSGINLDHTLLITFLLCSTSGLIIGSKISGKFSSEKLKKIFGYFTLFIGIMVIIKEFKFMQIKTFFDNKTNTFTYIVIDPQTNYCAVIDSVQDYNTASGKTETKAADKIIDFIQANNLKLEWILETHIHTDHLTGAHYIKSKLGGKIGIGEHILQVLEYWVPIFNTANDTPADASQFDHLFKDGEAFKIGDLDVKILHTPGHTPACVSYLIEDAVFAGDSIFMPHLGTARVDFPGGSAEILYESIQKILSLPDATRIFICHDYPEKNKQESCLSTVKEQRESNIFINQNITKEDYIKARTKRDKTLAVPKLLLPSIQINMRAGELSPPEDNNVSYIKIPLNKI